MPRLSKKVKIDKITFSSNSTWLELDFVEALTDTSVKSDLKPRGSLTLSFWVRPPDAYFSSVNLHSLATIYLSNLIGK